MILIDTSIWIDFLRPKTKLEISSTVFGQAVTTPIIIQEIFQGLKDNQTSAKFKDSFMEIPRASDPTPLEDYITASEIFSLARRKGLTIRSSADCLISAIAIKHKLRVWHRDRDYKSIAKITDLRIYGS